MTRPITATTTALPPSGRTRSLDTITAELRSIVGLARQEAVRRERERLSPEALIRQLAVAGIGAVRVPPAFGGAGGAVSELVGLLVELAAADSNLTQILRGHLGFVEFLLARAPGGERDELLRAAGRGELFGPAASVRASSAVDGKPAGTLIDTSTRLHENGGRQLLSGVKYYSTGSLYSEWINVLVISEDGAAEVVIRTDDPGVEIVDDWNGFGQRLTASGTARFDAVPVGAGRVFPHEAPGLTEYLNAFYQLVHSATQAGIIQRAGEDLAEVVRRRHRSYPLAADPSPRHDPQVLGVVGEVVSSAFGARAVVEAVARGFDRHNARPTDESLAELITASASAQVLNTRAAGEASWRLFDAASASATDADLALDRHWRNARTISSHNPAIYKSRLVGDFAVNGVLPDSFSLGAR